MPLAAQELPFANAQAIDMEFPLCVMLTVTGVVCDCRCSQRLVQPVTVAANVAE